MFRYLFNRLRSLFEPPLPAFANPLAGISQAQADDRVGIPPLPDKGWATWDVTSPFGAVKPAVVQILREHCKRRRLRYILDLREAQRSKGAALSPVSITRQVPLGFEECEI